MTIAVTGMNEADNTDPSERFLCLHEFVAAAEERLDNNIWNYLRGATETETTAKRNRQALDSVAFRPRVLNDMREVSVTGRFLGREMELPVLLAPVGSLESFESGGGKTAMRAAAGFGNALMLSNVGTIPIEEVSATADGLLISALYKRGDDAWLDEQVRRAKDAGCFAVSLTVDSAYYSRRERDIAARFVKPWRAGAGADWQAALNWKDVERFKERYDLPLILKGIATAEDAAMAVERGVDVVYVSNHGGRQLDHGRGALDVLPEVVDAVAGRAEIVVDGSIQRGTDLVKAIALGANAVGMGRLFCCALAAGGEAGVVRMLSLLRDEVRTAVALLGVNSLSEVGPRHVHAAAPVREASVFSAFPLLYPETTQF
ncbi:alpha-hydroxy-acid oxidizing protein [Nisaea acidiphila]|uniref:Alpha-hydroxy-acid oxidizing protein n=1 Tax=Nisaea acidiphila TaxID=1862145 RepID=A0A9J7AS33_9PROT|nr:alpha-hydroxy acid oxidase [Nisaea acidiphila]UUX48125.1 alpha-hydroxy-acid oxidizing protein [Nisaea acidiphila]